MSTEIQKTDIKKFISSDVLKKEIAKVLPASISSEAFVRMALTAITKVPKLAECDQNSIAICLLDVAQLGLTVGRDAHLIPFSDKCTLIVDYKGYVKILYATGKVKKIHADKVCENDKFIYDTGEVKSHLIDFTKPRGKAIAFYSVVEMDGASKAEVMTIDEIEAVRKRSRSANSTSSPWSTDFDEMAKKTVFKRCFKWLPVRPEQAEVLQKIDEHEFDFDMPADKKEPKFKNIDEV